MSTMSVRNLTWQQVIVCVAMLAAVVVAYKLFGELPAGVLLVLSGIVNALLGRVAVNTSRDDARKNVGPLAVLLLAAVASGALHACAAARNAELDDLAAKLAQCRAEGRDAGSYGAYERCETREGIAPSAPSRSSSRSSP